jgi:D-amino-acid oxidase
MKGKSKVAVAGAGPVGLFSATFLTSDGPGGLGLKGEDVVVFDRGDPRRTAGMNASAFVDFDWSTDSRRVLRWQEGSERFYRTLVGNPDCAVQYGPIHVFRSKPRVLERGERHLAVGEPLYGFPYGTAAETYRINPPAFLAWMKAALVNKGVRFEQLEVESFAQVHGESGAKVIINATGVGARALCDDPQVVPFRGHCAVVRFAGVPQDVRLVAGQQTWCVATGPDQCRIGGSSEEDRWDLDPDPAVVAAMFERVRVILPPGFDPMNNLLSIGCGLRPRRHGGERLELEDMGSFQVAHAYGSGGDGFTRGPGFAMEVCTLIQPLLI